MSSSEEINSGQVVANESLSSDYIGYPADSVPLSINDIVGNLDIDKLALRAGTKPHHIAALYAVRRNLVFGYRRGYVESATSSGKTFQIATWAEAFYNSGIRTLILTHSVDQADQLVGINDDKGLAKFTSIQPSKIGKHYGGSKATGDHPVVVATYAGLNNFAITGELGKFEAFLADEAHRSLGRLTSQRLNEFGPDAIKIGFSATPDYSADKKSDQLFERPFHRLKLREAIEEGVVAPVQALIYRTDQEIPLLDKREDFSDKELERLIHLKARNEKVIEMAQSFVSDGRQGIVACLPGANLLHARMIAEQLNGSRITMQGGSSKTITAAAVGSHEPRAVRREKLNAYERGEIDILTFVNSIAEGWDSSQASFLINACPTTSIVKITQLIGRVLRRKQDGRESIVVDFIDNALKQQATALAALDEVSFQLNRVIGVYDVNHTPQASRESYLKKLLCNDVYDNLVTSDASLLSDLHLKASQQDPESRLVAQYDSILASEGLTPEPSNELRVPINTVYGLSKFIRQYRRRYRLDPTKADVEEHISAANYGSAFDSDRGRRRLASMAMASFEVEPIGFTFEDRFIRTDDEDRQSVEGAEEEKSRDENIRASIDALPEREKTILEQRYGLYGEPQTLEKIGRGLGLTRGRVSQLEHQALSRLSSVLLTGGFIYRRLGETTEEKTNKIINQRKDSLRRLFHGLKIDAIKVALGDGMFTGYNPRKALEAKSQEVNVQKILRSLSTYKLALWMYETNPQQAHEIEARIEHLSAAKLIGSKNLPRWLEDQAVHVAQNRLIKYRRPMPEIHKILDSLRQDLQSMDLNDLDTTMSSYGNFIDWVRSKAFEIMAAQDLEINR